MYCMKKLLMAVAILGLVGFATSCKKECKCKIAGVNWTIPSDQGEIDTKAKCDDVAEAYKLINVDCSWK